MQLSSQSWVLYTLPGDTDCFHSRRGLLPPEADTPFRGSIAPPPLVPLCLCRAGAEAKVGGIQSWVSHAFLNLLLKEQLHPTQPFDVRETASENGEAELRRGCPGPLFQEAAHSGGPGGLFL